MALRLHLLALGGALAVLLAAPVAAWSASTARVSGDVLTVTSDAGEGNSLTVTLGADGNYTISDSQGMGAVLPCTLAGGNAECPGAPVTTLRIELGDGDDGVTLNGATPSATMIGGAGDDTLRGGSGSDHLIGETVPGDTTTGANTIQGNGGDDLIEGAAGVDTATGGPGADRMFGFAGADSLEGGDDNDMVDGGATDSDILDGGAGIDVASYATRGTPVNATIDSQRNDGAPGEQDDVQGDVEGIDGGTAGDVLGGSAAANALNGGPGDDQLGGGAGDDALDGGGDADSADGGEGNDSVAGGAGADNVAGGPGDDLVNGSVTPLIGSDGNDSVSGGDGNDTVAGGDADDQLDGGAGADTMGGGSGTDTVLYRTTTASLRVSLDGQAGDGLSKEGDNVQPDVENVTGGTGNATFSGSPGANGLTSGAGEDFLDGRGGADVMIAGSSPDFLRARDGQGDGLDCGGGRDFAFLDKRETSVRSCEFLDRGGPRRPRFGRRFVLRPLRGSRLGFGIPGMKRSVPLQDSLLLPFSSRVNPRGGTVRLLSARRRGTRRAQTGTFRGSSFLVKQPRGSNGLTTLSLRGGDFGVCAGVARDGEASAAGSRRVRRLFGRGRGRFRTRGRNSAATVRGTVWTMEDRCDGTLTSVRSGTVRVRDFGLRRTVIVRAGESYLAKARR